MGGRLGKAGRVIRLSTSEAGDSLRLRHLNLDPPRRRQLHARLPEGDLRVRDVVRGRLDRHDLRPRVDPSGDADGPTERGPHPLGNPVRPRPRRDLVLPQDVVRVQPELEVVRVPRLLRDVPVRGDPRRLQGDVPDLALLLREEVELHRELRLQVPDVPLADPDSGDPAHVLLAGVRLAPDLPVHRVRFPRHGLRARRRGRGYLTILQGSRTVSGGRETESHGPAMYTPSSPP